MLIPILCLVLALQEPRTESWPDGTKKAEYAVMRDAQGKELLHGPYRSFHENGAKAAAGNYADGLRSGPWETFFPDGKPESKGSYVRGAMSGRWSFWGPDGAKDLAASGMYELVVYRSKEDGRHYRGYFVDNLRQGVWTSYWPDKKVQLEGSFTAGKRTGRWLFTHPDGVPSSLLLSGNHVDGAWAGGLELPEPPPFDPALFPELEPAASGWPVRRAELRAELENAVARRKVAPELTAELVATGVPAIPVVLEVLRTLDPESERGRAAIGLLEDQALRPLCAGHALSPHGPAGPPDAAAARELVRAWLSLWLLTRTDVDFWSKDVPGPSRPGAVLRDVLQDPPILERDKHHAPDAPAPVAEGTPGIGPDSVYRLRFGRARESALRTAMPGTADGVARALAWLARHQAPDGHWSNADFEAECRRRGEESCGQPGNVNYDVGVSSLALLALMGDGNAAGMGEHAERVVRGLDWLVRTQTAEGLIGTRETHDFIYGHALATTALCEGFGLGAESLRAPAERAVAFLQLARHPEFAWRYDVPATEHGDTSVTGWALHALLAASHAGLSIDPAAFAGTLAFLDDLSDAQTGRVGYLGRGELSARNPLNSMFPNDLGEPLTGIGLWCRIQLGQRPATSPLLTEHAKLIASKPPLIDKQWGADQYHLYHGTAALWELGGPLWDAWQGELRKAVVLTQAKRADQEGSWDPIGPWAYALGRVGSTALMALTLETPYRYPRVLAGK